MTKSEFRNALCIMRSIDLDELQAVGLWMDANLANPIKWASFRDDPYQFFIRCDDETADKIWSVVEKRSGRQREAA